MSRKEQYIKEAEEQLKEWRQQINALKDQVVPAASQAENQQQQQLHGLSRKHEETSMKLEDIRSAGDDSWEELKTGYEELRDDMRKAIQETKISIDS